MPEIKIMIGDDPAYADPDYDDTHWPLFTTDRLADIDGVYWIRAEFFIGDAARAAQQPYEFDLRMLAAYELYLNGRLAGLNGRVGRTKADEVPGFARAFHPMPPRILAQSRVVLAMRLSSHHRILPDRSHFDPFNRLASNAVIQSFNIQPDITQVRAWDTDDMFQALFLSVPLIIAFYFLFSYLGNRQTPHFLVFGLLCCCIFTLGLADLINWGVLHTYRWYVLQWWMLFFGATAITILFPLYFLLKFRLPRPWLWILTMFTIALGTALLIDPQVVDYKVGNLILGQILVFILIIHAFAWPKHRHHIWPTALSIAVSTAALSIKVGYYFASMALLITVVLWQLAREQRQQRRRFMQTQLEASRLEAALLRRHIQPHFMMNSLTSLIEWVETDPDRGAEFIEALGDEFRLLTQIADQPLISLGQEIELCRRHLAIMGFRLRKGFHLEVTGIDEAETIPPAIFHTLTENGVTHNRFEADDITFTLTGEHTQDERRYVFTTPYTPTPTEKKQGGTGLKYIRSQLERAYPGSWRIEEAAQDQTWRTTLVLSSPIEPAGAG